MGIEGVAEWETGAEEATDLLVSSKEWVDILKVMFLNDGSRGFL